MNRALFYYPSVALTAALFGVASVHGVPMVENWETPVPITGTNLGPEETAESFALPSYPDWTFNHLWGGEGFNSSVEVASDNTVLLRGFDASIEDANDNWSEQRLTTNITPPDTGEPIVVTGHVGGASLPGTIPGNYRVGLIIGNTIFAFHPGFTSGGAQGRFIIREADTDANHLPFPGLMMGFNPATDGTTYEIQVRINPDDTFAIFLEGNEWYIHPGPIAGLYGGDIGYYRAYDNRGVGIFKAPISATTPVPPVHIYWTNMTAIMAAETNGSNVRTVFEGLTRGTGIDIHVPSRSIYYADDGAGVIGRLAVEGTGHEIVLSDRPNPQHLKIHADRIYWAELNSGLWSADLDGEDIVHLIPRNPGQESVTVGVDGERGYAYLGSALGNLFRTGLDGGEVIEVTDPWGGNLLDTDTYGLALNVATNVLYASSFTVNYIYSVNLDTKQVEWLHWGLEHPLGLALSRDRTELFVAERVSLAHDPVGRILVANANQSVREVIVSGQHSPFGIVVEPVLPEPEPLGFDAWIAGQAVPADLRGRQDDPDGDGIDNLAEYAFGGDPAVPDRSILPVAAIETVGEERYLALEVNRNPEAVGIEVVVEVSGDLVSWFSGPEHTTILTDTAERLVVRDNTPLGDATSRFIRARIVEQ